nr:zinc finger protein 880-like [Dermacentor andersoni]
MAEESSNEYTPLDLSMKNEAAPSTSLDGTQGASSTLGAYRTNADDALRYQGKTHHTPMTDETCSVDGVTNNGSTRCQHLGSIRSIDNVRPSTSRAGMEEASAKFEDSATNATGTRGREQQVLCGASGKVFSRRDTSHGQPNEITDRTAPMFRARDRLPVKKSNHKCVICGKLLSRNTTLNAHYRVHTGESSYKCKICHKIFAHRGSFHWHQKIHTGVKPFICQICTKPFKSKWELTRHLGSHSSDRPFVCEICNLSFKRRSHLRSHQRIHEGKMLYECKQCGFRSSKKENQDSHLCENIICHLCGGSFTDESQLIAHLVTHRGGQS